MRKLIVLLFIAMPTYAGPWHVLTAVPRAVGRSYANMFTFKHPWVATQQWLQVGAAIFDEKTTQDGLHARPTIIESNPLALGGKRPTVDMTVVDAILLTGVETTYTKFLSEYDDDDISKGWRNLYSAFPASTAIAHTLMGLHNMDVARGGAN